MEPSIAIAAPSETAMYTAHYGFRAQGIEFIFSVTDPVDIVRFAIVDHDTLEAGSSGLLVFMRVLYKPFNELPPTIVDLILAMSEHRPLLPEPAACLRPESVTRAFNIMDLMIESMKDKLMSESALVHPLMKTSEPSCLGSPIL